MKRPLPSLLAAALLLGPLRAQEPGSGIVHEPFPIRIAFTGDVNLGTRTITDGLPADSGRSFFDGVRPLLAGDLVVGNFEGVLSDTGYSLKCGPPPDTTSSDSTSRKRTRRPARPSNCYAFATPTWMAPRLSEAGFTHLNLANNHANDYGADQRNHTEETFHRLGLVPYGPFEEVAITPVFRDGRMTLVGLVGFTTYSHSYNLLSLERSRAVVDSVRRLVDVLVVTFHGGAEGAKAVRVPRGPEFLGREPRGDLRRWARAVIDAGADAVVGHGPHVLRGVEFYRGRPIFYSLGNFATYRGFNLDGPLGLTTVLSLELDAGGGFLSARMPSLIQQSQIGPVADSANGAIRLLQRVTRLDFPGTGARIRDDGAVLPPE